MLRDTALSSSCRRRRSQSGLTLVEILIVVVILIVGILTVVELFPSGFDVLRGGQNASSADRLAKSVLDAVTATGATPPDGIYAGANTNIQNPGTNVFDPTIAPDDLTNAAAIAGVTQSPAVPDVDKSRYISNETFTLGASNPYQANNPEAPDPVHVLSFGPIVINNATHPDYNDIKVISGNWAPIVGNSSRDTSQGTTLTGTQLPVDNPANTLVPNQAKFMVDYTNGKLAVAPEAYPQDFVFTVTPVGGTPTTVTLTIPANVSGGTGYDGQDWFAPAQYENVTNPPQPVLAGPWVVGSALIYRPFAYIQSAANFTLDPYQYRLSNPNTPPGSNFNVGALAFNPAVGQFSGVQAITAKVSYTTYDWHILHEDHDVPAADTAPPVPGGNNGTVRLAIDDIKQVGDTQQDGSIYTGFVPESATGSTFYDILFLDLDSGEVAGGYYSTGSAASPSTSLFNADTTSGSAGQYQVAVSYRNGRITLPYMWDAGTGAGPQFSGNQSIGAIHHVRIFYEGKLDWALALQRAPAQYVSATSIPGNGVTSASTAFGSANSLYGAPANYPTGQLPNLYYYPMQPAPAQPNTAVSTIIYFPLCDENKTIELDNVSVTAGTATGSLPAISVVPTNASVAVGNDYVSVDLSQVPAVQQLITTLGANGGAITPLNITFGQVSGISARAVVIWRVGTHWREHTLDTLLSHS